MGVCKRNELRAAAAALHGRLEKGEVALRPDVEDLVARLLLHQSDRNVARRHDGVERVGRNPELQHLSLDRLRGTWRVADENNRAAPPPKRHKRIRGLREGGQTIVQDAPDVAQDRLIAIRDLVETRNLPDNPRLFPLHRRLG